MNRGRPLKKPKNYPELMMKLTEEANRLQSEANSIALRRFEIEKRQLLMTVILGAPELGEDKIDEIKKRLDEV